MDSFVYTSNPSRVIFGSGELRKLSTELDRLKLSFPLLLSTPRQKGKVEDLADSLEKNGDLKITVAGIFHEATMHTPTHVTDQGLAVARSTNADCLVSFGGGSTIGLGKAISVRTGLPHICIPTTYSGSEMTAILGETADGVKKTRSDPKIMPCAVIYDVDLTVALPSSTSATSGVNAIAHGGMFYLRPLLQHDVDWLAVEALYASNANPIINLMALEGIRALAKSLPAIVALPPDIAARTSALYGAWLCATCVGSVNMSRK
jgi:alcohol dehydrogenase class IV